MKNQLSKLYLFVVVSIIVNLVQLSVNNKFGFDVSKAIIYKEWEKATHTSTVELGRAYVNCASIVLVVCGIILVSNRLKTLKQTKAKY